MANAVAGVGTVFQRLNPNTAVWDDIAEINSIEGPNEDRDTIDVTSLDTEGGYDEFITGFMEGGTLVLNMNFNRNGYEVMKQDFEVDLVRNYRIVLPDDEDTTLDFEGLVTEIPITMEADNQLTADVTIQVSGEVTIASAGAESSVDVSEEPSPEESMSSNWTPAEFNPVYWWDFGDESTVTLDGSEVAEITSKGSVELSLVDESAGNNPGYVTGSHATFDGSQALINGGTVTPQSVPFTALFDIDRDATGTNLYVLRSASGGLKIYSSSANYWYAIDADGTVISTNPDTASTNRIRLAISCDASWNVLIYENGVQKGSGNIGGTSFAINSNIYLGTSSPFVTSGFVGKMYEVIIVPSVLSPEQLALYEEYCLAK